VACKCYKRAVQWMPEDVLGALLTFFANPSEAPALWISGLPIDVEVPPTPKLPGDFRLPVCESWLLGVAQVLGVVAVAVPWMTLRRLGQTLWHAWLLH